MYRERLLRRLVSPEDWDTITRKQHIRKHLDKDIYSWEDKFLNSIGNPSENDQFIKSDPQGAARGVEYVKGLELDGLELKYFGQSYSILKDESDDRIHQRIDMARKLDIQDKPEVVGFHKQYELKEIVHTELLNKDLGSQNEIITEGINPYLSIETPGKVFDYGSDHIKACMSFNRDIQSLTDYSTPNSRITFLRENFINDGWADQHIIAPFLSQDHTFTRIRRQAVKSFVENLQNNPNELLNSIDRMETTENTLNFTEINEIVSRISSFFIDLTYQDFTVLISFIEKHEHFALHILEPYIICICGNILFKVILPLHKEGVFTALMIKVRVDYLSKKGIMISYMYYRLKDLVHKIKQNQATFIQGTINVLFTILGATSVEATSTPDPTVEEIAEEIIEEQKSGNKPLSQKVRDMEEPQGYLGRAGEIASEGREKISQTGVEIGKGLGKFSKGLKDGFFYEWKDDIADSIEEVEKAVGKNKKISEGQSKGIEPEGKKDTSDDTED